MEQGNESQRTGVGKAGFSWVASEIMLQYQSVDRKEEDPQREISFVSAY